MVNHSAFGAQGFESGIAFRTLGRPDGPVLVLGNSLGTDSRLWRHQVDDWARDHRVICFEYPGHGSPIWRDEPTIAAIAHRLTALLDYLGVDTYSYCGLSMGGAVGMELTTRHPTRLTKLVLSNTAPNFGSADFWAIRGSTAVNEGLTALADVTMSRWFTEEFAQTNPSIIDSYRTMLCAVDPAGYEYCCHAVGTFDFTDQLASISQPTLVIAGTRDRATTVEQAQTLHKAIDGSAYLELEAAHLGNVGASDAYTSAVRSFISTAR